jgi:2-keto-4-pentenoate hydratase/2-oxohepta-3-ene-1,7-dioic acid hydratase in catechol pathway
MSRRRRRIAGTARAREGRRAICSSAPAKLVSLISQDMSLAPGDVIACGTSVGMGSMKPGSEVSIVIEGIRILSNRFE